MLPRDMRARNLVLLAILATAAASRPAAADAPGIAKQPKLIDEGTFRFTIGGQPAGDETFRVERDAQGTTITTKTTLGYGGAQKIVEGTLVIDDAGHPLSASIKHGDA